jgi:putative ABC transport system substrate-binding protein
MMTSRIPIVFIAGGGGNPVEMGLIETFDRPGGNITGVTHLDLELSPKRLELFHEIIPGLKQVLFPYDPADVSAVAAARGVALILSVLSGGKADGLAQRA